MIHEQDLGQANVDWIDRRKALTEFGITTPVTKDAHDAAEELKYSENQPRVPAGQPGGGEFGEGGGDRVRVVSTGFVVPGAARPVNLSKNTRSDLIKKLLADAGAHAVTAEDYMHLAGKYLMAEQDMDAMKPEEYRTGGGKARADKFYALEETMGEYETTDSWLMNQELRAGHYEQGLPNHTLSEMDECFKEFGGSFEDDKVVFRGAVMEEIPQKGEVYHDEAFVSTINTPDDAIHASSKTYTDAVSEAASPVTGSSTVWEITIPKGSECLAVRPDEYKSPADDSFQEIVLPRGADLVVDATKTIEGVTFIKASYLGSTPKRAAGAVPDPNHTDHTVGYQYMGKAAPTVPPGREWRLLWLPGDLTKDSTSAGKKGGPGSGRRVGDKFRGNRYTGGISEGGTQPKEPKGKILTYEKMSSGQREAVHHIVLNMGKATSWGRSYGEFNRNAPSHALNPNERNSVIGAVKSLEMAGIDHEQLVRALAYDAASSRTGHAGSGAATGYTVQQYSQDLQSLEHSQSPDFNPAELVPSKIEVGRAEAMAEDVMRPVRLAQFAAMARESQGSHLAAGLADPNKFPAFARESLLASAQLAARDGMLFNTQIPPGATRAFEKVSDLERETRMYNENMEALLVVGHDVQAEIDRRVAAIPPPDPMMLERMNRQVALDRAAMHVAATEYSRLSSSTFSIRNDTAWMNLPKNDPFYRMKNDEYERAHAQIRELRDTYDRLSMTYAASDAALRAVGRMDRLAVGKIAIEVLSEIRPFGSKLEVGTVGRGAKAAIPSFERAAAYFPTEWYTRAFGRTLSSGQTQKMNIGVSARPHGGAAEVLTYRSGRSGRGAETIDSTSVHETGHFMEDVGGRSIKQAEWKFMLDRTMTGGVREKTVSLNALNLSRGLGRWSRASDRNYPAYADKFADVYMGKLYSGGTPESNFELLTMGMENLRNPTSNSPKTDADYKAFILGMLATL